MTINAPSSILLQKLHANRGLIFPLACVSLLLVLLIPLAAGRARSWLLITNLTLSVLILVTTIFVASPLESAAAFRRFCLRLRCFDWSSMSRRRGSSSAEPTTRPPAKWCGRSATSSPQARSRSGAIIFLIIFLIQFIVITKGGSRISEVAARFMLDAMPGKQMAIDADVSQGIITQRELHRPPARPSPAKLIFMQPWMGGWKSAFAATRSRRFSSPSSTSSAACMSACSSMARILAMRSICYQADHRRRARQPDSRVHRLVAPA